MIKYIIFNIFIILSLCDDIINKPNIFKSNVQVLYDLMTKKSYNKHVRPYGESNNGPVNVEVDLFIRSISNLNEINMEYSTQITLRQKWFDERLSYGNNKSIVSFLPEYFILTDDSKIWMVDTFFPNEKNGHRHMIDKPNMLLRIYGNGKVLYSVRLSLVLSCPMYLQVCL